MVFIQQPLLNLFIWFKNYQIFCEITNLVKRVYQGEMFAFPLAVGDFGTAEEALTLQKPFNKELVQRK